MTETQRNDTQSMAMAKFHTSLQTFQIWINVSVKNTLFFYVKLELHVLCFKLPLHLIRNKINSY